ncbi:DoxX family protein [Fulvivirgaceae bacterium BMA10]|uniref:DoxX family protein n=1 Tax=Splendidivirga corallicola TaxID=3051826 RepID=A0ABT8L281_9BACT|nr:DoxX family protein [Fulvivirgaceae bacterium BMA10]
MRLKNFVLSKHHNFDLAIFFIRCSVGALLCYHGIEKFVNFSTYTSFFPNPLGLGSKLSLILVTFSELIGGLSIMLGFFTRLFLIPVFITLTVAFFLVHAADAFQTKELAFLFWLCTVGLTISGPGKYSFDYLMHTTR